MMASLKQYPMEQRCRWWCEMNCHRIPKDFPVQNVEAHSDEFYELFSKLTNATPERERMSLWQLEYC